MAKTKGKQSCPTCGQSANMREEKLNAEMMQTVWQIFLHCKSKQNRGFDTDEVKHLVHRSVYANFAKLRFLNVGIIQIKSGKYSIDPDRIKEIFLHDGEFAQVVVIDPLHAMKGVARVHPVEWGTLKDLPRMREFMEEDEFVVRYRGEARLQGKPQTLFGN